MRVPQDDQQRDIAPCHLTLHQRIVESLQQVGWTAAARGEGSHTAVDHGSIERGRRTLATGISECDGEVRIGVFEKVVEVPRDFTRGAESDGDFKSFHGRRFGWKQDRLQLECGSKIFLHAPLALADLVIQAGILHRNRYRRGQQTQCSRVVLGEESDALAFEIQYADHAILHDQRHGNLGTHSRMRSDIAGIGGGVVDSDHLAGCCGRSSDAFAQRNVIEIHALVEADAEPMPKRLLRGIDQQDAESVVIDEAAHAGRYFAEQFVDIENGSEFVRNPREGTNRSVLALGPLVKLRIVNRGRDTAGDEAQHGAVVDFEAVRANGLNVDHSNEAAPGDHGHAQLAANGVGSAQVPMVARYVRDENRLTAFGCRVDNSFTEAEREVAHDFFPVAYGIADAQIFPLLVEQENGKKIVGYDPAHDCGDVGEQLIQFESLRRKSR